MADVFTPAKRSRVMAAVRSRGNRSTELALATAFKQAGLTGWRRHYRILGKPDFAFPMAKIAVFVDGCFWHGCPRCGSLPVENRVYWGAKISRNVRRDRLQNRVLRARGWTVLRVWEHTLRGSGMTRVLRRIQKALARRLVSGKLKPLEEINYNEKTEGRLQGR